MVDAELKQTARDLVYHCYLRVLLRMQGDKRSPGQLDATQRELLLGAWQHEAEMDLRYAETLLVRAQELAVERANESLHSVEGLDHEMVDEAIEFALRK